jgi:hypothetical protein
VRPGSSPSQSSPSPCQACLPRRRPRARPPSPASRVAAAPRGLGRSTPRRGPGGVRRGRGPGGGRGQARGGRQTGWRKGLRSRAPHSTAQHSTAQHSTAQHSTTQHSTAQHSTAQHAAPAEGLREGPRGGPAAGRADRRPLPLRQPLRCEKPLHPHPHPPTPAHKPPPSIPPPPRPHLAQQLHLGEAFPGVGRRLQHVGQHRAPASGVALRGAGKVAREAGSKLGPALGGGGRRWAGQSG